MLARRGVVNTYSAAKTILNEGPLRKAASLEGGSLEEGSFKRGSLAGGFVDEGSLKGGCLEGGSLEKGSLKSAFLEGVSLEEVSFKARHPPSLGSSGSSTTEAMMKDMMQATQSLRDEVAEIRADRETRRGIRTSRRA